MVQTSSIFAMQFAEKLSEIYPCRENGYDSFGGVFTLLGIPFMGILYLAREKNRQFMRRYFGFTHEKADEEVKIDENKPYEPVIIWHNVLLVVMAHIGALFAIYSFFFVAKWQTIVWVLFLWQVTFFSIPGGCHRLYSHRSFKASKLYEVVIMCLHSMLMQNSIIHWARDHRCHHKFVDTDADPHTPTRGMFFAHIGWLLVERHPEVIRQGKKVDISDLTNNPVLAFQRRYLTMMYIIFYFTIPFFVPQIFWGERFWTAWYCCLNLTWCLGLYGVGVINSYAHSEGIRPYCKNISAADGIGPWRHLVTVGEGDHNFHHAFPQDYRSSEHNSPLLFSTHIITFLSWFGLTYDLKVTSKAAIEGAKLRNLDAKDLGW